MTSTHRLTTHTFARAAIFALFVVGGLAAVLTQHMATLEIMLSVVE